LAKRSPRDLKLVAKISRKTAKIKTANFNKIAEKA
jgi:hypothetical protein